jgi:adenylate cyclase
LDLAGFSKQTAHLASFGPKGAEELSVILKDTFAPLVDVIDQDGGDIVAFVGDGIIAVWDSDSLVRDTRRATLCGLKLQRVNDTSTLFRMRVAIECGEIFYCRLGGTTGRSYYMVVGAPLVSVGTAYRLAAPGDVVLCPAARETLGEQIDQERIDSHYSKVIRVAQAETPTVLPQYNPMPFEELQRLLPPVVLERGAALDGRWLAEFRSLSIVQVSLSDVHFDESLLPALEGSFSQIEKASLRLEGSVLHIRMDDKGINAIVVFGLPPLAHEDDPFRAIEAALSIEQDLSARGYKVSIGVTTGLLFCGEYGGAARRDYSALGTAIVLSSRLMEQAGNGVLCDAATAAAVEKRVTFSASTTLRLKGWARPVAAFRPEAISRPAHFKVVRRTIGRDRERRILRDALDKLSRGTGGVVCIEGEAGIGKSTLLSDVIESARATGLCTLHGVATAVDHATPYFAWREVLAQLLASSGGGTGHQLEARLLSESSNRPELAGWLPLLEDIMPLGLEANFVTRTMSGASRAAGLEELVIFFLDAASSRQPMLVAFDDVQWMDEASVSLARAVARRLPRLLLVAAGRPTDETGDSNRVRSLEPDTVIRLGVLSNDAVIQIVCQRLGVSSVPTSVAELVTHRAAGNPFYCEELTFALRDTGVVRVDQGDCWASRALTPDLPVLPQSLKSLVVTRFDAVPPEGQLALKVASALGGSFSLDLLQSVYPHTITLEGVEEMLDGLVARNMLKLGNRGPEKVYEFRHGIFQDTVYELLSFSQRRKLHKDIASIIELRHEGALDPLCAQLARHWEFADRPDLAIAYLERAAAQALRSYANLDAIRYLRKAMQLSEGGVLLVSPHASAAWQTMLGDANHELRDFDQASVHYQNAMQALGYRLPSTRAQLAKGVAANALRQAMHRFVHAPRPNAAAVDKQRVAHIYERLSEEYFYRNDPLLVLHGTLASLNLAEQSGAIAETISGYNGLALGLGMAGMAGVARQYSQRASRLAEEKGDLPEVARAHLVAGVLTCGLGDWTATQHSARKSALLFRQLGDRVRLANSYGLGVFEALLRCDITRAQAALNDLEEIIAANPDVSAEINAWRLCARICVDGIRGSVAQTALDELREVARGGQTPANLLLCKGVMSGGYLQIGDLAAAKESAREGAAVLQQCSVVWAAFGVFGAGGATQTLIALWERAVRERWNDRIPLEQAAQQAMFRFLRLSARSPVCRPWAYFLRGRAASLAGDQTAARHHWHQAVRAGQLLGMLHVVGLACLEIGASSPKEDRIRTDYLARAQTIFAALGVSGDLARVRNALAPEPGTSHGQS